MGDARILKLGDVKLVSGETLTKARLAFATHGTLNDRRDNCILLPTYYAGTHRSYEPLIGRERAIDPALWFVVIPNLFGNGQSSSPSQIEDPAARAGFPHVTIYDNVVCQRVLLDRLGVHRVAVAAGWSLGAIQAYHWAAMYPDMVDGLLPFCGAARCWPLNRAFLDGLRAALRADPTFADGSYCAPPEAGLRAFARVYAGWAYSACFFRDALYERLGHGSPEALMRAWEAEHLAWDANDLLTMLWSWEHADLGNVPPFANDFARALAHIKARAIVMPCDQDRYFTLAENEIEVRSLRHAELRPFRSPYGHCAGAPGRFPGETAFLTRAFRQLLAEVRGEAFHA